MISTWGWGGCGAGIISSFGWGGFPCNYERPTIVATYSANNRAYYCVARRNYTEVLLRSRPEIVTRNRPAIVLERLRGEIC